MSTYTWSVLSDSPIVSQIQACSIWTAIGRIISDIFILVDHDVKASGVAESIHNSRNSISKLSNKYQPWHVVIVSLAQCMCVKIANIFHCCI